MLIAHIPPFSKQRESAYYLVRGLYPPTFDICSMEIF